MKQIQLQTARGVPVYFLIEKFDKLRHKINFATTDKAEINDELFIGFDKYRVDEFIEERPCKIDFGQELPLVFQSAVCTFIPPPQPPK